ncbi:MAG: hypothetical protein KC443_16970 [Anaerolineales bacterium]|nr:hypothetical protein [Anaerolineales bacterium]
MGYLAILFPSLQNRRLPLTRDQLMLLMAAVNLFFLGLDTYLAHLISGTIRPREWIPILFGPTAGVLLLIAGLVALRHRQSANWLATFVLISSTVVGLLGAYFHMVRGSLPTAPAGSRLSVSLLIWAPPVVAPLTFALVGLWGLSAAWIEEPADSGTLRLWRTRRLTLPYSKTRAYLFMVSLGILATLFSSVLDHARTDYANPWLWIPFISGVFGTIVTVGLGAINQPKRSDVAIYVMTMLLLIVVGLVGAVLHVQTDLVGTSIVVPERFLRGAPFLAPLLFANMGMLGLIAILSPVEQRA